MNQLLTQVEVCTLARISYPTLCRWLNAGIFPQPVNGRRKKLLFDPAAIEAWIKKSATSTNHPPTQQRRVQVDYARRQAEAKATLQRHYNNLTKKTTPSKKGGAS